MADPQDTPENELRLLLQKVARRIRSERGDEHVTDSQMGVLWRLDLLGSCTPGELATSERVTPPSMNRTVNALEEAGYVARTPSPDDARKVLIALTDRGRAVTAETRRLRARWFSAEFGRLSSEERERLLSVTDILRKLAES
ncbi:MAG: transcriptional regulator, MarR family [Naasia sp.]|jgi:DNA-binding MarR family transcriptional regulator|uniref:MarR family winged helix-turn-helix transcriptional regulator n=1 Tax=Naasia sp. TaxID=2546198 RepID=UPI0026148441|nr:MarR family transcriptional regulator [Naasia sp.]MCU1570381.1 transcriptional regulator, MarR family [Naasia sp.]